VDELDPIVAAFDYIDVVGGPLVTAEVELGLGNGQSMSIKAGGGASTSSPPGPPFSHYEVILDHDPPRFWHRYSEDQLVYSQVPRLHIAHHAIRRGGVVYTVASSKEVIYRTPIRLPITTMEELAQVLAEIAGREVSPDALR
jgi:hypothetical protein